MKLTLKCAVCGREFQAARRDVMTCSPACKVARRNAVRRERRQRPATPPRRCERCGREFHPRHAGQRYCGAACRRAAGYAEYAALSSLVTRWSDPPDEATLFRARERPPRCSERRWRIELARRRDPERYAGVWDGLPWRPEGGNA